MANSTIALNRLNKIFDTGHIPRFYIQIYNQNKIHMKWQGNAIISYIFLLVSQTINSKIATALELCTIYNFAHCGIYACFIDSTWYAIAIQRIIWQRAPIDVCRDEHECRWLIWFWWVFIMMLPMILGTSWIAHETNHLTLYHFCYVLTAQSAFFRVCIVTLTSLLAVHFSFIKKIFALFWLSI